MAKERVITTWGVTELPQLTGSTETTETPTAWRHFGPVLANRMYFQARFTLSGTIKTSAGNRWRVRAAFAPTTSDISTAHSVVVAIRTSTNQSTPIASTVAYMVNYLRVESTALVNGILARAFVSAIP